MNTILRKTKDLSNEQLKALVDLQIRTYNKRLDILKNEPSVGHEELKQRLMAYVSEEKKQILKGATKDV